MDKLPAIHGIKTADFRRMSAENRMRVIRNQPIDHAEQKQAEKSRSVRAAAPPQAVTNGKKPHGPGWHLKTMLAEVTTAKLDCRCESTAAWMDSLKVVGCRKKRAEIITRINQNRAAWSWVEQIEIAAAIAAHAFDWHLSPLDPIGSLVDEAIRRAEAEATAVIESQLPR